MVRPLRALSSVMVRTEQGPLRPLWAGLHAGLLRAASAYLRRGHPDSAVFIRGSFACGDPAYGLSDMDVIVVLAGSTRAGGWHRERLEQRWRRLCRAIPGLARVIALKVYEEAELADAAGTTALTYGLGSAAAGALFHGEGLSNRHYALRTRPDLYGATRDWRHLAGPDRRPPVPVTTGHDRLVAGWLELQCWWRYVAWCCLHPEDRKVPYYCFKFVAEAARIWLWVAHGERTDGRLDALRRATRLMPADEALVARVLATRRDLASCPGNLLSEVLAWLVCFSSRLAGFIATQVQEVGSTDVSLCCADTSRPPVPLVDWRALVMGEPPDGRLILSPSSPCTVAAIARAALAEQRGSHVALQAPGVLVLPSADLDSRPVPRGALRTIQCDASDPVSLAVVRGDRTASFPNVRGWSAIDLARRAVAEHRMRVLRLRKRPVISTDQQALLLSAARAALFLESLEDGEPQLHISGSDIAEALAARYRPRAVAAEDPEDLERAVSDLPAFQAVHS